MTPASPIRQPSRPALRPDPAPRRGGRYVPPSRTARPAPEPAAVDPLAVERHILAREGQHAVALMPAPGGGFRYVLLRFQPVTQEWITRASGSLRDPVLAALWKHECWHAEPLGWPDDPRFGLHLHELLCGPAYPLDVSGLSAAAAAAIPHGLEWC